jgi:magnesium chelatase family protein
MIAKRIPVILSPMTFDEAGKTIGILFVSGRAFAGGLIKWCTFRKSHHISSAMALAGYGTYPRHGEVSLLHNGVLLLISLQNSEETLLKFYVSLWRIKK